MWKVYNVQDGSCVKGGFSSEEQAKDWIDAQRSLRHEEHEVAEMDEEEEEEFLESHESEDEEDELSVGAFQDSDYSDDDDPPRVPDDTSFDDAGFNIIEDEEDL